MSKMIVTADWHLRDDRPRCRIDENWNEFQLSIIVEIIAIANKNNCDIIHCGDMFNAPTISDYMLSSLIALFKTCKNNIHILFGNHDLPYHSLNNLRNASAGIIEAASLHSKNINIGFNGYGKWAHFGNDFHGDETGSYFMHRLVFPDAKSMPPNVNAICARDLLKEFPKANWIYVGDMHKSFHYEKDGKHVINPGCIIRQAADFKDYKPSVFLVDEKRNSVEKIYLHDDVQMVDDAYLRKEEEREERIGAFIDGIKRNGAISLSIVDNLRNAIKQNKKSLSKPIINTIEDLIEEALK